jgi:hypothetical protein
MGAHHISLDDTRMQSERSEVLFLVFLVDPRCDHIYAYLGRRARKCRVGIEPEIPES